MLHLLHDPQALEPGDEPGIGLLFIYQAAHSDGRCSPDPLPDEQPPLPRPPGRSHHPARQNKTLIAEVAYLRDQLPSGTALHFTDRWRKRLARAVAGFGWKRLADLATGAKA